jgi:hypothetical protein
VSQTVVTETAIADSAHPNSYVEWAPIIAGAFVAAAISFVLLAFGSAIGLTAASPWPDSSLPTWLVVLLAALWVLVVQAGSYALGGYLSGRLRAPLMGDFSEQERRFRDGSHGFVVWAVGAVVSAAILAGAAGSAMKPGANAAAEAASSAPAGWQSPAVGYAIDGLMRSPTGTIAGTAEVRGEVASVFAYAVDQNELLPKDKAYLGSLVAKRAGVSQAEGEQRVNNAFSRVQTAVNVARKAAMVAGFLIAASMMIAAAAAAAGANLGGRHRDERGTLRFFGREHFW